MKNDNTPPEAPWMRYGTVPKMGLRLCDEADWLLERDYFGNENAAHHQITLKAQLCRTDHETIFQFLPEADDASAELNEMIVHNLKKFHQRDTENNPRRHPLDNAGSMPHHFSVRVQGAPHGAQAPPPLWLATARLAGLDR